MSPSAGGWLHVGVRSLGIALVAAAVAAPRPADAALTPDPPIVTGSGGVSVVGTPTIMLSGAGTPADPVKLSGSASFINNDSGNAHLYVNGLVTAAAGDLISITWDMTIDLPEQFDPQAGHYIFYGNIFPEGLPSIGLPEVFHVLELGAHQYTGSATFDVPIDVTAMPIGLELQIYMSSPGTLELTIPNNSIDLSVGPPVPEPGTAALAGVAVCCGAGALSRKRRRRLLAPEGCRA